MPTADPKPSVREEQHINDLEYRGLPDGTIPGEGAAVQELAQIALRLLRERDEAQRDFRLWFAAIVMKQGGRVLLSTRGMEYLPPETKIERIDNNADHSVEFRIAKP